MDNNKNIEYSLIDIEETISDFVQSIDIDHKNEVISYISEIYNVRPDSEVTPTTTIYVGL